MANNIVLLEKINKVYGETSKFPTQVLFDVDLSFQEGSFNSIIGQSGSGKSTLLNVLGTLDKATSGEVSINGVNIKDLNKKKLAKLRNETIGFIFQFHYLLLEFTVLENVLMPFRISKQTITDEIMKRAEYLIEFVGLSKYKNNISSNLSGGQQQRVAIARSLMNQPKIILADEPTGNLDSDTTNQIYDLFRKINQTFQTTFIIITHDQSIAQRADRIIEIKDGKIHMDVSK